MGGEDKFYKGRIRSESNKPATAQAERGEVLTCLESRECDPKPVELIRDMMKPG